MERGRKNVRSSRAGLTFRGARCHTTTGGGDPAASRALLAFVRHPKSIRYTFHNLFCSDLQFPNILSFSPV